MFVRRLSFLLILLYFSSSLTFGTFVVSVAASVLDEFAQRAVHFGLESVKIVCEFNANKKNTFVVSYTSVNCYCYSVIICNSEIV